MNWKWQEDSILNNYTENTPSRDIFKAMYHEFGLYFEPKGGKYTKSGKRISFIKDGIKLVIGFNSSRSNLRDDWIAVELGISFYYLDFIKLGKDYTGVILGDLDLFSKKLIGHPDGTVIIRKIIENDIQRIEEGMESEERFGNVFNCYGLTESDFLKIVDFLEKEVLIWLDKIHNKEGILEILENPGAHARWSLGNSKFRDFLEIYHPDLIETFDNKITNR